MRWRFEVPGKLPSLNEYTDKNRGGWESGSSMKKSTDKRVKAAIGANPPRFEGAVDIWIVWVRPNMRADKDNVRSAVKFIQDALQKAGVIKSDGWKWCTPHDVYRVDKSNPRTVVIVQDAWEPAPTAEDFAE